MVVPIFLIKNLTSRKKCSIIIKVMPNIGKVEIYKICLIKVDSEKVIIFETND